MKKKMILLGFIALKNLNFANGTVEEPMILEKNNKPAVYTETIATDKPQVLKITLENGMVVLVYPTHTIPKVSIQIWYNVGSKDEKDKEKGIAHLIEHMIFKGTTGEDSLNLSESDINTIVHMLSGSCNAFTTQDFTGYLFNMPTHTWHQVLPIIADCMRNASFKEDHLNSEMKAVIQELKMRRDNYTQSLAESMLSAIFTDHPYHYPIIGFKQDLWSVHAEDLRAFYHKHYVPNNATLIVVGDVDVDDVFSLAKKYFADLEPNHEYKRPIFHYGKDISSKSVTLYRDVSQPVVLLGFVLPGLSSKTKQTVDILSGILGNGKSSRLPKKLVDELQLVTSLSTFHWDLLFDHSIFFIAYEPKDAKKIDEINGIIFKEINDIVVNGVQPRELERSVKQARMQYYALLENTQQQAFDIGKFFLATRDENFAFKYLTEPDSRLQEQIRTLLADYMRPSVAHQGLVLPLPEQEKKVWASLQKASDEEDQKFLAARPRSTPIEAPSYLNTIILPQRADFSFPKAKSTELDNGIKVFYHHNANTPKINLTVTLKARDYYDPQDQQGLYNFMTNLMTEGTKNYTAAEFADELESRGISISVSPGAVSMSMLTSDLEKGLEFFVELLTNAVFDKDEIEKVRAQILSEIKSYWDNPSSFSGQLIREHIYKDHPYSKNSLGTQATIEKISQKDLMSFYKKVMSPDEAAVALVGDLSGYDIPAVMQKWLGKWNGPDVEKIAFPVLKPVKCEEIKYQINRDQVVLCFAAPSIDRLHEDYLKLLVFDQILGGGMLGSMSSRLFDLREQSGLFYSINGSLIARADEQPGMVLVKTMVSKDRLEEAQKEIKHALTHSADEITAQEFQEAKDAILTGFVQYFESNGKISSAFLFLNKYDLPANYFDTVAAKLAMITIQDMKKAVKNVLKPEELSVIKIGRV